MATERTLAIIKPNAVRKNCIGKIIAMAEEAGLKVTAARMKTVTSEEAEGFYAEHRERPFFPSLSKFMTSGPVLLLAFERENAVEKWRKLMGATDPAKSAPGTIRKITYQVLCFKEGSLGTGFGRVRPFPRI